MADEASLQTPQDHAAQPASNQAADRSTIHGTVEDDEHRLKTQQDKERRETAIASATGISVLSAIAAVPVRLMKRDLLFVAELLTSLLDENRLAVVARQHGIKKAKHRNSIEKLLAA